MVVYLINIALILFWRLYFTQKRDSNSRKHFCTIAAIQWILISGLRDWSVGADTYSYYSGFERVKSTSWGTLFGNLFGYIFQGLDVKDPGYAVITKLFQLIFKDYQLFLLAIAIFFMTLMAIWIYKNSASPCTSFILFSTLFYSYETLTRQNIAIALVVFLGYDLIKKRKLWSFAAVSLVAFLIHKSSLVFFPMYFLSRIPVTLGYMFLAAIVIAVVAILGESLYAIIATWMGFGEGMIYYAEGGAETYATLLILLCAIIWIMFPSIKKHRNDADMLFHVNSLSLLSALLVFQNQSFMRIQLYYSIFLMITIPELINTVKREHRIMVYLLFGVVMILYLIRNNPQYQFFFMS